MKCQRQLLQISWQQFIRNDEVAVTTGLLSISEVISNRRSTLFSHVARLQQDVPAHTTATSTCLLVDHPTTSGNVVRADHERDGLTRSGGSVEACDESWSPRSNATALAGFAITTTKLQWHLCCLCTTILNHCQWYAPVVQYL